MKATNMLRVALINMPFAYVNAPSMALLQLRGVLAGGPAGDRLSVSEHHLNIAFAKRFHLSAYNYIANSPDVLCCGLGDWMFRKAAFPDEPDNVDEYFHHYRHRFAEAVVGVWWKHVLATRESVGDFLDAMIDQHHLDEMDLVGFSSMFAQTVPGVAMARALKRRRPEVLTLMGGANCESPMGECLARHLDCIDYIFSGPALVSLPAFIDCVLRGDLDACAAIDGVFPGRTRAVSPAAAAAPIRLRAGSLLPLAVRPQKRPVGAERDIDALIDVDFEPYLGQLSAHFTRDEVAPMLYFETSRGCWWGEKAHCTFCGLNGSTMHYRSMSPDNALAQFDRLFEYRDQVTQLFAVDNILPREYFTTVLPRLNTPADMHIFYEIKADVSDEQFKMLAHARVLKLQPGIEALATPTLKLMKKGTTAQQNIAFLRNCGRYGIYPSWNILVGFPGESEEIFLKYINDVPLLMHLPPPNGVYPIRFDRFSPYHARAADFGLKLRPMDFYQFVYPIPKHDLTEMAYFFVDESVDAPYARAVDRWLERLRAPVYRWRALWDSDKTANRPVLRFADDEGCAIVDTRSGDRVDHDFGPDGRVLLDYLARPRRESELSAKLADELSTDVGAVLAAIRHAGLVFEEGDRLLSLVDPPPRVDDQRLGTRPQYGAVPARLGKWA